VADSTDTTTSRYTRTGADWRRERKLEKDHRPEWSSGHPTHTLMLLQELARADCHVCTLFNVQSINNDMAELQPSQLEYHFSFNQLGSGIGLNNPKSKGFYSLLTFSLRRYAGERVRLLFSIYP
jgi:hypothetical protein